jgi:hypothetical protein
VTIPDEDRHQGIDIEAWQEDIDKVFNNHEKYIGIENMDSSESFRLMEEFVNSLGNNIIKTRLLQALEGRKPFANFGYQIDNLGNCRELWFAFRRNKTIKWVQNQLLIDLQ